MTMVGDEQGYMVGGAMGGREGWGCCLLRPHSAGTLCKGHINQAPREWRKGPAGAGWAPSCPLLIWETLPLPKCSRTPWAALSLGLLHVCNC